MLASFFITYNLPTTVLAYKYALGNGLARSLSLSAHRIAEEIQI